MRRGRLKFVVCLSTVSSAKEAEKIARSLVTKRLVACVNIVPGVTSVYHWKKKLCREREILLILKTTASRVKPLERELQRIHPYELPEFLLLPIIGGSRAYLDWVASC